MKIVFIFIEGSMTVPRDIDVVGELQISPLTASPFVRWFGIDQSPPAAAPSAAAPPAAPPAAAPPAAAPPAAAEAASPSTAAAPAPVPAKCTDSSGGKDEKKMSSGIDETSGEENGNEVQGGDNSGEGSDGSGEGGAVVDLTNLPDSPDCIDLTHDDDPIEPTNMGEPGKAAIRRFEKTQGKGM